MNLFTFLVFEKMIYGNAFVLWIRWISGRGMRNRAPYGADKQMCPCMDDKEKIQFGLVLVILKVFSLMVFCKKRTFGQMWSHKSGEED